MPDSIDRKPTPQAKEPANIVLNRFLEEKGIIVVPSRPEIDFTQKGSLVISPPGIIAMYKEDTKEPTVN